MRIRHQASPPFSFQARFAGRGVSQCLTALEILVTVNLHRDNSGAVRGIVIGFPVADHVNHSTRYDAENCSPNQEFDEGWFSHNVLHYGMITASMRRRYLAYLQSEAWQKKRSAVILRAHGKCERCGQRPRWLEVHHKTYKRLYRERLSDLLACCPRCHELEDRLRKEAVELRRERRFSDWKR